jgi:hypothetical protein
MVEVHPPYRARPADPAAPHIGEPLLTVKNAQVTAHSHLRRGQVDWEAEASNPTPAPVFWAELGP